jgi:hypothetical protein
MRDPDHTRGSPALPRSPGATPPESESKSESESHEPSDTQMRSEGEEEQGKTRRRSGEGAVNVTVVGSGTEKQQAEGVDDILMELAEKEGGGDEDFALPEYLLPKEEREKRERIKEMVRVFYPFM